MTTKDNRKGWALFLVIVIAPGVIDSLLDWWLL